MQYRVQVILTDIRQVEVEIPDADLGNHLESVLESIATHYARQEFGTYDKAEMLSYEVVGVEAWGVEGPK